MKTVVHVVPHSHWDRAWYMPYEHHHARLVSLMDDVLELLQQEDYTTYHLDGQMIAIEDYLQVRPQKRALIEKLVRAGRLKIGPYYVLQDTYLTGSEANVRNLQCGMRMAEGFGAVCKIGYLPDAFGNAGQMPQIFRQAGMIAAVFGRGVTLMGRGTENAPGFVGFGGPLPEGRGDPKNHFPCLSEFEWEAPDGARIPSVYFACWYSNGMEIPTDPEKAKAYWDARLAASGKFAATRHLLMMNGCDHQPVQKDLTEALAVARNLYPEVDFVQSSLEDYARAVLSELEQSLEVVPGELADHQGRGHTTLRNTASARWYLKALNRRNEVVLEKEAEPAAAVAAMAGIPCNGDLFDYAWRTLMQNHPHDSICGCSCDEVHSEMVTCFNKSIHTAEWLLAEARFRLGQRIAAKLPPEGETGAAFAVWNSGAWARSGVVKAVVGVDRVYGTAKARAEVAARPARSYCLYDSCGNRVPCEIEDDGIAFGYDLPDDRFRQPYFERRMRVTFLAENIPAFGYETYLLAEGERISANGSLAAGPNALENDALRVDIAGDGTFILTDKRSGRSYPGLGAFEDTGDVGDEYVFQAALGAPITTKGVPAKITLTENSPFRAAYAVEHTMRIPAAADDALAEVMQAMDPPREQREIARSGETVDMKIVMTLSLDRNDDRLGISVKLDNNAKDHRVRILFPTGVEGDSHYADSVFDLVRRTDVPGKNWINPSRCDRMQLFNAVADETGGLAVSNRGLYEYEMLDEGRTLALTLLRAVGEIGDWGVFPTPEAQCPGEMRAEMKLTPVQGEKDVVEGYRKAHEDQFDLGVTRLSGADGDQPARKSFFDWSGDGMICTSFKAAADGDGTAMRLFNAKEEPTVLEFRTERTVTLSDVLERRGERLAPEADGVVRLPVRAKEIVTVRIGK